MAAAASCCHGVHLFETGSLGAGARAPRLTETVAATAAGCDCRTESPRAHASCHQARSQGHRRARLAGRGTRRPGCRRDGGHAGRWAQNLWKDSSLRSICVLLGCVCTALRAWKIQHPESPTRFGICFRTVVLCPCFLDSKLWGSRTLVI